MLKFIKHYMTSIDGIEIYPLISLVIFTIFFAILLWRVIRMDADEVNEISNYPLK